MFFKVGALENVAIFSEKHLCRSIFLNKVAGLQAFSVNIAKFFRTAFLQSTSGGCFCNAGFLIM